MIVINGKRIERIVSLYITDDNGYVLFDDEEGVTKGITFTMDEVDEIRI